MTSTTKTIAKNTTFIAFGNLISRALSFIFMVFVVRQLGGTDFGKYSTVMAYVGIFAIFSDMGMATYATREIAQDKSKTGFMTWNMIFLRLTLSLIVVPVITLIAIGLGYPQQTVLGIFVAACGLFIYAIQGPIHNLMRGYERLDVTAIFTVVERIVFILFGSVVLVAGMNFVWLIVGSELAVLASGLVGFYVLIRTIGWIPFEIAPRKWLGLIRAGLPFGTIGLTTMISWRVDTIMLSLWMTEEVVGWYNVAYGLLPTLLFFSDTLNGALGPTLARTFAGERDTANSIYQSTFRMLFIVAIPITVGTAILADRIIILLYTAEFAPAASALAILVWAIPLTSLGSLCSSMATASHKENNQARIRIIAAVINVAMNLYAIPRFGLIGAAVTTLITELIIFVLLFILVNDQFVLQKVFHIVGKPLLAALMMGAIVWFGRDLNLFLMVGLGAIVYGVMLFALRAVNLKDPSSVEAILLQNARHRLRRLASGNA